MSRSATDQAGNDVYLKDIWPTPEEVAAVVKRSVRSEMFQKEYSEVFQGDERWNSVKVPAGDLYEWSDRSTYIRKAPYFDDMVDPSTSVHDLSGLRALAMLGDSVTTDHISPAGSIPVDSPAGKYLIGLGVKPGDFNSYGARRGNHEVMVRGTFANIRLRNLLAPGTEGGWTTHIPERRADVHLRRRRCATSRKARRWSSSPARSTAPAPRATGRPRARCCSACAP